MAGIATRAAQRPARVLIILGLAAVLVYLVFAVWPDWLVDILGRK